MSYRRVTSKMTSEPSWVIHSTDGLATIRTELDNWVASLMSFAPGDNPAVEETLRRSVVELQDANDAPVAQFRVVIPGDGNSGWGYNHFNWVPDFFTMLHQGHFEAEFYAWQVYRGEFPFDGQYLESASAVATLMSAPPAVLGAIIASTSDMPELDMSDAHVARVDVWTSRGATALADAVAALDAELHPNRGDSGPTGKDLVADFRYDNERLQKWLDRHRHTSNGFVDWVTETVEDRSMYFSIADLSAAEKVSLLTGVVFAGSAALRAGESASSEEADRPPAPSTRTEDQPSAQSAGPADSISAKE